MPTDTQTDSAANRRPAIVGAAQYTQRVEDPKDSRSPLGMMETSLRLAAEDAGAPALLAALDAIYVPQGIWRYGDPGKALAERVGAGRVHTIVGSISGHMVQLLVNRACEEIASGRRDVVAVVGAESENSKRRLKRADLPAAWSEDLPGEPDERIGSSKTGVYPFEMEAGIKNATSCFGLCETSLRHARGETPSAHRDRISELYARLSRVAAKNPYAWIQREYSAAEIREPTPANRMVSYPYTKLMTSNISVDQGAALILCSEEAAQRFGIAPDKKVFLRGATEMSHSTYLSDRQVLHNNPGQAIAARRALELLEITPDQIPHIDLYSCFPFAIQAGAEALGIDLEPFPSLTGGMTFFGGPLANYVIHSKVHLVERLRADPGAFGAIGSVGGFFQHFSFGLYSSDAGERATPLVEDVSAEYAALPTRAHLPTWDGRAEIEAYTVDVRAKGPVKASFTALTEKGERVWGRSEDPAVLDALLDDQDPCGRSGRFGEGLVDLD